MLSKELKTRIEVRYGKPVRYPKDCVQLSVHIYDKTNDWIKAETLENMLGFKKKIAYPGAHALDVLAIYLGSYEWYVLPEKNSVDPEINTLYEQEKKYWRKKYIGTKALANYTLLALIAIVLFFVIYLAN